uniref:Retrovirus-related Pol polyprotein from transposon TNT 1-94 n=1 Tax=Cannabis sativa TaxID=3483 RepID=A0A803Q0C6_CANSA
MVSELQSFFKGESGFWNRRSIKIEQCSTHNNQQVSLPRSYPISFNHSLSIKLDENNFLPWKHQVLASIKGSRLQKFLDDTRAPEKFLTEADQRSNIVNSEFEDWEQQDNLLVSWLLSSMSEKTTNRMIGCDTTTQIWENLTEYYTALNAANVGLYKTQLRNTKMTGSLSDNLLKIKGIVDQLATIGHTQTTQDHIETIFNGLPPEYDVFVTSITTRKETYTVAEVEALLMAQSVRIEKNAKSLDISKAEVNLSQTRYSGPNNYGRTPYHASTAPPGFTNGPGRASGGPPFNINNGSYYNPTARGGQSNRGGPSQNAPNRGGSTSYGRGQNNNWGQKVQCQLCHKLGLTVKQCFYRFDKSFTGPECFANFTPTANIAEIQALYATPESVGDEQWYPDTGATHHLTPDLANLSTSSPYSGNEQVYVGNGMGLNIKNIGNSFIHSPFNSKQLSIRNLLHVPSINKNLLSVSQFAQDNGVFFEFYPFSCCVKDIATQKTLLAGNLENGLYKFQNSQLNPTLNTQPVHVSSQFTTPSISQCNSLETDVNNSAFSLWHSRLGHPAARIVTTALSKCNISVSNKKFFDVCKACCLGKSHKLQFPTSTTTYNAPLELLHSDLWGPVPTNSSNGYRYYISFVDAYSRYTWLYLLRTRDEALPTFTKFKTQVELQL